MKTTAELKRLIERRIKEETKRADEILAGDMDSPGDTVDYGMARGARWALEWVLSNLDEGK